MNDVKLSGRLTRDPELKQTPNGVPVATTRKVGNMAEVVAGS